MKTITETLTPERAKQLLDGNTHNRPVSQMNLKRLCEAIRASRWKLNGETIKITECDKILDGQHRLMAVVQTGIAIETAVSYGVDHDSFDTIDIGKPRSGADTLATSGEKNANALTGALRFVHHYTRIGAMSNDEVSNSELLKVMEKHPGLRGAVTRVVSSSLLKRLMPQGLAAGCLYFFRERDRDLADRLVDYLQSGIGFEYKSPAYLFRERLITNAASSAKLDRRTITALFIKTWNAHRMDRPLKTLKWLDNEPFPSII